MSKILIRKYPKVSKVAISECGVFQQVQDLEIYKTDKGLFVNFSYFGESLKMRRRAVFHNISQVVVFDETKTFTGDIKQLESIVVWNRSQTSLFHAVENLDIDEDLLAQFNLIEENVEGSEHNAFDVFLDLNKISGYSIGEAVEKPKYEPEDEDEYEDDEEEDEEEDEEDED